MVALIRIIEMVGGQKNVYYMTLFGNVIKNLKSLEPNSNAYLWKGRSNLSCLSQFHYKGK
jgi:hypothetical protein